jgi:hypothetical protein
MSISPVRNIPPATRIPGGMIVLKERALVAQGLNQLVYQHPHDPDLLIKTLQVEKAEQRWLRKWGFRVKRRYGIYSGFLRELHEYFAIRARIPGPHPSFLQRPYGIVDTDLGLGFVVGKVKGRNGELAPTLAQVVERNGFTAELHRKIETLKKLLDDNWIVTNNVGINNVVYAWSESEGDHLVIIEGLGEHTLLPASSLSPYLNRIANNRHFARLLRSLEKVDRRRPVRESR